VKAALHVARLEGRRRAYLQQQNRKLAEALSSVIQAIRPVAGHRIRRLVVKAATLGADREGVTSLSATWHLALAHEARAGHVQAMKGTAAAICAASLETVTACSNSQIKATVRNSQKPCLIF